MTNRTSGPGDGANGIVPPPCGMGCKSSVFRQWSNHHFHPVVQADRTAGFQPADPGADPGGVANFIHAQVAPSQRHGVGSAASAGASPALSTLFFRTASFAVKQLVFTQQSTGQHRGGSFFYPSKNHCRDPAAGYDSNHE